MSSRRKKISTRNKKQVNKEHLETKKEIIITSDVIELPTFPELKKEMDQLKVQKKKKEYEPTERYLCEDCNIYLLYKNINRHVTTKTHKEKEKH
jgi:uncharacterized protein YlaI